MTSNLAPKFRPAVVAATIAATIALTGCVGEPRLAFEFAQPFDAPIPDSLTEANPYFASEGEFTWDVRGRSDQAIRGIIPVVVYLPGDDEASQVPDDFVGYLESLSDGDAVVSEVTVDGIAGERIDFATEDGSPEGSFGCVATDLRPDDVGCLGLQGDRIYRMVVIERDDEVLVFWVRTSLRRGADVEFFTEFDEWVAGIRFTD